MILSIQDYVMFCMLLHNHGIVGSLSGATSFLDYLHYYDREEEKHYVMWGVRVWDIDNHIREKTKTKDSDLTMDELLAKLYGKQFLKEFDRLINCEKDTELNVNIPNLRENLKKTLA